MAHLLPFCFYKPDYSSVLAYLQAISGLDLDSVIKKHRIDSIENVILLSQELHFLRGSFQLVFRCTNEEDVYKVEFDEWASDNFVVAQLPPNALVDFRRAERPPSRVFFALFESLYGIAHANAGAEALLLPVLQLEPDEVDVGFEDGRDYEVALALVDGN